MATETDKAPRPERPGREKRSARTASAETDTESVWLAGLGALKEANERGAPFFQRLVKRGREAIRESAEMEREVRRPLVPGSAVKGVLRRNKAVQELRREVERDPPVGRGSGAPRVVAAIELQEDLRARIADQAIARIWEEDVLKPGQVALALGGKESNREKAASLRKRSSLLGVPRGRGYLYPAFQIDVARREVYPEVREVNETLGAAEDPWGIASWWLSSNDRLGARPADLVGSCRTEDLVQAAKAVTAPIG
jgi:hypothetical protein